MKISATGVQLIKQFEGCVLTSYKALPTEKKYTIGYGHYGVEAGITITKKEADDLLERDLERYEALVNKYKHVYNYTQCQFDALVSFAFNVGNIDQLSMNGTRSLPEISNKMLEYVKSGGKTIAGLVRRRRAEHLLFNTNSPDKKSNDEIAIEVIEGRWGNGSSRKIKLESCGYNYSAIQKIVNSLLQV